MKRSNKYPHTGKPVCKHGKAGTQARAKWKAERPFKGRGKFCFQCWLRYVGDGCPECGQ